MSSDAREDILERLATLLGSISGIKSAWRNRGELKDVDRPAVVLLDGVEDLTQDIPLRKTVKMPPAIFKLQPQIFVLLQIRDNTDNLTLKQQPAPVGPEISSWRMKVLGAIVNDPQLLSLLTANGQIVFKGSKTDMQSGSTIGVLGAQLQMDFDLYYVLQPPRS